MPPVVWMSRVTKRFSGHVAVRDLSLEVPAGSIYGLLGPNGAGKTTSIRMIMNILVPDAGEVQLWGTHAAGRDLSHRIGYLPEERGLYKKMRVMDLLLFLAETKGLHRREAREEARRWLERLGLGDWRSRKLDELSKGMQQKVQFVSTVLHRPQLLILDEPFAGLDPVNAQVLKDVVLDLARDGTTVLFSTHIMEQAEKLCDAVCIIARGEKVVDGPVTDVKRRHGGRHVIVGVERSGADVGALLRNPTLVSKGDDYGQYAEVELADGVSPQTLLRELVDTGALITRFEVAEPSLHKIFIDLVGPAAATPERADA